MPALRNYEAIKSKFYTPRSKRNSLNEIMPFKR